MVDPRNPKNPQIELDLLPNLAFYHWNDKVEARVVVNAGTVNRKVRSIRLLSLETWYGGRYKTPILKEHEVKILSPECVIEANSCREFLSEFVFPSAADLSHRWRITAEIELPFSKPIVDKWHFDLQPPRALMGLKSCLSQVAPFEQIEMSNVDTLNRIVMLGRGTSTVTIKFRPPMEYRQNLDSVKFIVQKQNDRVRGIMEIDLREHSLSDQVKALLGRDLVKHEINFPAQALEMAFVGQIQQEIVGQFQEFLSPYLW